MQIIREVQELQGFRNSIDTHQSLGLVPTMGALHHGHTSLVQQAVAENDYTIVSIFVNPTQFAPGEDLEQYPRTWTEDIQLLESLEVDAVFSPEIQNVYLDRHFISFAIQHLNDRLEGISRPGHMEGVLQIVSILFHLVQPHKAYFGLKDYQQYMLVSRLVKELHFPISVIPCPIVREKDGLAMSSRNAYLNYEQRAQAIALYDVLEQVKQKADIIKEPLQLKKIAQEILNAYPLVRLDYFEILNGKTLDEIPAITPEYYPHAFIAAYLGQTRLIDNMSLL